MDTTPTDSNASIEERDQRVNDVVARILARSAAALSSTAGQDNSGDAGALEREARAGTRRVDTGASDREDISEVEYRTTRKMDESCSCGKSSLPKNVGNPPLPYRPYIFNTKFKILTKDL